MKVDYQNAFIYKLCCKDFNVKDIYVGHSTNFKQRNQCHKTKCNNINNKEYKYRFIRDNGGFDNWIMIKLYDYPCDNKRQAEAEECKIMIELGAKLNSYKPFILQEEKKQYNKEYQKEYRQNNKEELSEKKKEYYQNNKTEILERRKEYKKNNKSKIKKNNKEKIKCEFCNCEVRKYGLTRHQKTLKCMKFQEFIDIE